MCTVITSPVFETSRSLFLYKTVTKVAEGRYESSFGLWCRNRQSGFTTDGTIMEYRLGHLATSDMRMTPGMYCYTNLEAARHSKERGGATTVIVQLRIPEGTKMSLGFDDQSRPVAQVETLVVLKEVE